MPSRNEFVVTLDGRTLPPRTPLVRADDPVFCRGDGVFETLLVRRRRATLLAAHVSRLVDSAALAGLPPPDAKEWRAAARAAAHRCGDEDAVLRLVHGRGHHGGVVAFVAVGPVPERVAAARRDGVSAMTLDRGPVDGALSAAKSSSYARNAAALRHAERQGCQDVVFLGSDEAVLEGPRSTVVIDTGAGLITPPAALPILPGTTVAALFAAARQRGVPCREGDLMVADLLAAQSVWLLSAVTLAARVHTLDGVALEAPGAAHRVPELVDAAIMA